MQTQHVMTTEVITVRATTAVDAIARLLTTHGIGGVPVVDDRQRVLGIVSQRDLFLKEKGIPFSAVKIPTMFKQWVDPRQFDEIYERARHNTAADVMTDEVICVDAEEELEEVARLMVQGKLKRIPVLRAGRLVGIITRVDLIRGLANVE